MRSALLLACVVASGCGDDAEPPVGTGGSGGAPNPTCSATEVLVDGACVPVGPASCGEGFTADGRGGCVAVLPTAPCAPGEVALPGEQTCRPLVACDGSRWGAAPIDATTEFVDAAFVGVSDGSETRPWQTVTEAVEAAAPGATVAIAAGTYPETVWFYEEVHLWGSCPTEVTIHGPSDAATIVIIELASGASVSHLGVSAE